MKKIANDAEREYSCLMAGVPQSLHDAILQWSYSNLPDAMIHADEGLGRELKTHVTVKYGLHTDNADEVMDIVKPMVQIPFTVGTVSTFTTNPKYDVLILPIKSDLLVRLNDEVSELFECTDTHPTYIPHLTIAYVKKGTGEQFINSSVVSPSEKYAFESIIFSDSKSNKVEKRL